MLHDPFKDHETASILAEAIVETVRELLLVLNTDMRVIAASRSFYETFRVVATTVTGISIYEMMERQFDLPELRSLLDATILASSHHSPDILPSLSLDASFTGLGERKLIFNARRVHDHDGGLKMLLLAVEDVTEQRLVEDEKAGLLRQTAELLRQKDILLQEMQHRVANSLQIIASILMLKARSVTSEESRQHLHDAHRRVLSVATVQQHIQSAGHSEQIDVAPYLIKLCEGLSTSMISDSSDTVVVVAASDHQVPSAEAVSLGLIVMELVINALKHAFPVERTGARVDVSYESVGTNWQLIVSDNGVGKPVETSTPAKGGLGTSLIKALAQHLDAQIETSSSTAGFVVTVTKATFNSRLPSAA